MSTITVRLIGGLGNQMFQYAAARALALHRDVPLLLDVSGFESYGLRRYELDSYPIVAAIAGHTAAVPPQQVARTGLVARVLKTFARPAPLATGALNHYREPHFHFDPHLAAQSLPLLMDGYWQSERYFLGAATQLRGELTPAAPLEPVNAATVAKIDAVEAVSVHVRRGDYVANAHTNTYHGVCSLDYYRDALAHIRQTTEAPHLFVFSDDHDWTRDNLKSDLPTTYVTANPADRGFRDMQLMSRCRHHVIANSSFSWWGAWLNPRADKIVVAPKRWFAAADNDTNDLVPQAWVRL